MGRTSACEPAAVPLVAMIPISTHDLLTGLGLATFYVAFTLIAIHQWRHPEHVPARWFPFHEEPADRTTPQRVRSLRIATVLALLALNGMAVAWIVQHVRR